LGRLLGLLDQYAMRLNRQVQANRMELIVKMKARAFIEKMKALEPVAPHLVVQKRREDVGTF
jgi:hypothetical protein